MRLCINERISLLPFLMAFDIDDDRRSLFIEWYEKYRGPLYHFIFKQVREEEATLDLHQESFARVISRQEKITGEDVFRRYLYTVAVNLCRDRGRRKSVRKHASIQAMETAGIQLEDQTEKHESKLELKDAEQILRNLLESMPEEEQQIFFLKKVQGLTYKEISEITQIPERTLKRQVKKSLDRLLMKLETAGLVEKGELL